MYDLALGELMADTTVVSIGFGPGLDTKTDPKVTSKPVLIKDGIFTNPHRISKRFGNDIIPLVQEGGTTFSDPVMVKSYKDQIVCAANGRLYSYSPNSEVWFDRGKYVSAKVSLSPVSQRNGFDTSSAVLDGKYSAVSYGLNASVIDLDSGTYLECDTQLSDFVSGSSNIRVVCMAGTTLAFFGYNGADVGFTPITITPGTGIQFGSFVSVFSGASVGTYFMFDCIPTSSGAVISYYDSGAGSIKTAVIDVSGTVLHTATLSSSGKAIPLSLSLDPSSGNIWVYWIDATTLASETLYYSVYSSSLSVVVSKTSIHASLSNVRQISAVSTSSTQQSVYYGNYSFPSNSSVGSNPAFTFAYPIIYTQSVDTSGIVGSQVVFLSDFDVYSKIISVDNVNYMAVCYFSQGTTAVNFLVDLTNTIPNPQPVAKFLTDRANSIYYNGSFLSAESIGYSNSFGFISEYKIYLSTAYQQSQTTKVNAYGPVTADLTVTPAITSVVIDFDNIDAYQGKIFNGALCLNGGIVYQYDGSECSEIGFEPTPDNIYIDTSTTGGNITAGNYVYYVTFSWTDALGNLYESAPSIGYRVNFASGVTTGSSSITAQSPFMSGKGSSSDFGPNYVVNLYRTLNDETIAYLIGSEGANPGGSGSVSFSDHNSDSDLANLPTLYTEGGAVLENTAPPPSMVMWETKNRLWAVNSENPETEIQYSKTASQGTGISFSTGQLEYIIDSKGGEITGGSLMDEKTVVLKKNAAGYFIGDGANDSGGGGSLTNFQFIPSTTGCSNSKSVVLYNDGILFRASNDKGIYKVSRGTQIGYFGLDVESYNAQDIVSALNIPNKTQIRFLTSDGSSLLYDYVMGQWSVFSNYAGLSADQYQGRYVYVRSVNNPQDNNQIFIESESSFLDNATSYNLSVKMQWIKGTSIQDFYRLRRVMMLGDFENGSSQGHGVQISAAYDFGNSFSQPVQYLFGEPSSSGSFQYRERLAQQKCDSVQLLIEEIVTGASGEYCDFTDLGLEIAPKRGLNKLPQYRSVG